jgi:hypothetical protein
MQLWQYFSRLPVVVKMRGNAEEHLGCSEVLFDCCLFQLQVSFSEVEETLVPLNAVLLMPQISHLLGLV